MTTPVPSNGAPQPMRTFQPSHPSSSSGTYTHRTWMDEMAYVLGHVVAIHRALQTMQATLDVIEGGKTQMDLVAESAFTAMNLMVSGVEFVADTDTRYMAVFEAIQRAGGQHEVAKDKRYHDRA